MSDFQRKKTKFRDLSWENFNCRYIKSYICILFQSASDGRHMRNTECTPRIRMYTFPCRPLMISLATELVVIVEHSCEGTHWHYSVPSERLTRETFHCAVRTNDTRTPGTFTEKKRAALEQPVVVRIHVSSFKQLFATRSAYLHSIHAAPGLRPIWRHQVGEIQPVAFRFLSSNYSNIWIQTITQRSVKKKWNSY